MYKLYYLFSSYCLLLMLSMFPLFNWYIFLTEKLLCILGWDGKYLLFPIKVNGDIYRHICIYTHKHVHTYIHIYTHLKTYVYVCTEEGNINLFQYSSILSPGESHGHMSLVGKSPWGCKELDTAEWLTHIFVCTGKFFRYQKNC